MSSEKIIKKILKDLKKYSPQKIIIFGSFVKKDKFKKFKDIDILIIKKTKKPFWQRYIEVSKLLYPQKRLGKNFYGFPFDILVLTPEELEKKKNNFFFQKILKEGKVIYEKRNKRMVR